MDMDAVLKTPTYPFKVMQVNGQRIVTNETVAHVRPVKGCEIFIGNLPHDLFECELIPIFGRLGIIHNIRIMMDFTGRNRGFAFLSYVNQEDAFLAITTYNNYKVRQQTKIAVTESVDNRRLFIGNVPRNKTSDDLKELIEHYVDGVNNIIMYNDLFDKSLNRGFAFVEFNSHREAAIARRQLSPGNLMMDANILYVDWAEPMPIVKPHILKTLTKLYLRNIPCELSTEDLAACVYEIINPEGVIKVHKSCSYAFLHFVDHKSAEKALQLLNGALISNNKIEAEWARPMEYSKRNRTLTPVENYCRSVPPRMRQIVSEMVAKRQLQLIQNRQDKIRNEFLASDAMDKFEFMQDIKQIELQLRNTRLA